VKDRLAYATHFELEVLEFLGGLRQFQVKYFLALRQDESLSAQERLIRETRWDGRFMSSESE
jgi:hypothetical protein